ncbi:MAG: 4Fe-4S binding protein [Firmicutes bacterium]|nr:4Fe-4S binding protein [Bacillota bacterium]
MKQITVVSGKGGTGKTTLTAAFASLSGNCVVADCDVDAPDLHLLLDPQIKVRHQFVGGKTAQINETLCLKCGICLERCRFEAITAEYLIEALYCEGCGVCVNFCPVQAVNLIEKNSGQWYISETRLGPMVHAQLGAGEDNSGKLVTKVREEARRTAEAEQRELVIIDGPPGIGCPAIASITGTDYVVVVTEPSRSGRHDLERVVELVSHFGIRTGVCINKYDLNQEISQEIMAYCLEGNLDFLGTVPFDRAVVDALVKRQTIIEAGPGPVTKAVRKIWERLNRKIN